MIENDTQNSQQAASTALHNAPKLAKNRTGGNAERPCRGCCRSCGAVSQGSSGRCRCCLAAAGSGSAHAARCNFGTLTQPSTAVNDDLEIAANVIQLRNAVSDILQAAYEDALAEIESERASLTYSDVVDSVGGHVSYNAFQLISMYCAYQGEDDYTKNQPG